MRRLGLGYTYVRPDQVGVAIGRTYKPLGTYPRLFCFTLPMRDRLRSTCALFSLSPTCPPTAFVAWAVLLVPFCYVAEGERRDVESAVDLAAHCFIDRGLECEAHRADDVFECNARRSRGARRFMPAM